MTTSEAAKNLHSTYRENYDRELFGLPECCEPVNEASCWLIRSMAEEHGEAWLGVINRHEPEGQLLRPVRIGAKLTTFCASFVLPKFDGMLLAMLSAWNRKGGGSVAAIDAITNRVTDLGGYMLGWS